jgi:TolB-like protein
LRLAVRFFVITNLLFLCYSGIAIPNATKVAILPLQVNAGEDIEYINRGIMEMLVSRITYGTHILLVEQNLVKDAMSKAQPGTLTKEKIQKIGDALGAEYVIFGSISKIGNNLSMDINVLNVLQGGMTIPAFTRSVGLDEVIPEINILAQDIREAISTGFRDLLPETTTTTQPPVADGAFIEGDSKADEVVPAKIEEFDLTGGDVKADKPESPYEEVFPETKREHEPLDKDPSDSNRLKKIFLERKSEVDSLDENPVYQKSVDDLEEIPAAEQK